MLPAGRDVGAGGNEIDRIGEPLLEVAKNGRTWTEWLKLIARKWAVKVRGQGAPFLFKKRAWTMRSIIPALAGANKHPITSPCHVPPPNKFTVPFAPEVASAANASLNDAAT